MIDAPHDRMEPRRDDVDWVAAALAGPQTLFVVLGDDGVGEVVGLPDDVDPRTLVAPVLLGRSRSGRIAFALDATGDRNAEVRASVARFRDDRVAVLRHDEPGLLVHGLAMARWHSRTRHCPRCGARLEARRAGHVLRCPDDDTEHFPRLEPAMIVAVVDADDRVLLGRQGGWPDTWLSTLAGFVEPGETIEAACRREVAEESGVTVDEVTYVASQPWPFPASLMIGLRARAATTDLVLEDEIVAAEWFTRDQLRRAFGDGRVAVPPPQSIANRLISDWFGGPVRDWTMA